jgi:hypothetical protein
MKKSRSKAVIHVTRAGLKDMIKGIIEPCMKVVKSKEKRIAHDSPLVAIALTVHRANSILELL